MKLKPVAWGFVALALAGAGFAQQAPLRSVNVTTDSAPGWIPTEQQESEALAAAQTFLKAQDEGRTREAWDMMAPIYRANEPLEAFAARVTESNARSGAAVEHRVLKVTWTKDGPNTPMPGAYAAIDLASRYANVDRQCGYIVAYQPPQGGPFQIMRIEIAAFHNDAAATVERTGGREAVESAWRQLSAHCPGGPG